MDEEIKPWIPYCMMPWLDKSLNKMPERHLCFEWGSGGSTFYFAQWFDYVVSVEHSKKYLFKNLPANAKQIHQTARKGYVKAIEPFDNIDLIFVDGRWRNSCLALASEKSDFVILDNSDRAEYAPGMAYFDGWERLDFSGEGVGGRWMATAWLRS